MRYVWITADYLRKMLPGVLAALAVFWLLRLLERLAPAQVEKFRVRPI